MAEQSNGLAADTSSYAGYGNTDRLLATPSNTPQSAYDWINVARAGQQLNAAQLETARAHLGALNDVVSSVMADPTMQNATARISDAVKAQVLSPQDGATELSNISALGGDPDKIRQYAFQHGQNIATLQQRMDASYGTASLHNNGQQDLSVRTIPTGPNAGTYAANGNSLQRYMDPGQANAPADYTDGQGRTIQTTVRGRNQAVGDTAGLPPVMGAAGPSAAPPAGYGGVTNPGSYVDPRRAATAGVSIVNGKPTYGPPPGGAPPVQPGEQPNDIVRPGPVGGTGQYGRDPVTAGAGVAAGGPGAPQPVVPGLAGPSPMLTPGREDYRADLTNSTAKMQAVQPLVNALPLIAQLGDTGSGPGTKAFNQAKSALVSAGIIPSDMTDVDVRDEANKYLRQYVAKSGIAQRSDMGTLTAEQSSPNLDTSNKATLALTRNAISQDRMEASRPLVYSSDDLSGYSKYRAGWTQSQDSRAYGLDLMPADQRTALLQQMAAKRTTPEGRKFFSSLQNAMTAKMLTPPGAPATAGATGGQ